MAHDLISIGCRETPVWLDKTNSRGAFLITVGRFWFHQITGCAPASKTGHDSCRATLLVMAFCELFVTSRLGKTKAEPLPVYVHDQCLPYLVLLSNTKTTCYYSR